MAALAALTCGVGCSFPDYAYAPTSTGVDAGVDASSPPADASTGAPNLVENPGCEDGLAPWTGYQGRAECDPAHAHAGTASFLVTWQTGDYFTLDRSQSVANAKPGETYRASAWVRTDETPGTSMVAILLRETGGGEAPSTSSPTAAGARITVTADWQEVRTELTVAAGRNAVNVYFNHPSAKSGDSFNVDDVVVERTR